MGRPYVPGCGDTGLARVLGLAPLPAGQPHNALAGAASRRRGGEELARCRRLGDQDLQLRLAHGLMLEQQGRALLQGSSALAQDGQRLLIGTLHQLADSTVDLARGRPR